MLVPPEEERGEMGKFVFCFLKLFNFYFFLYISFFYTRVYDMYVSVMCRCGAVASNSL
jgi:hypothetical protein